MQFSIDLMMVSLYFIIIVSKNVFKTQTTVVETFLKRWNSANHRTPESGDLISS